MSDCIISDEVIWKVFTKLEDEDLRKIIKDLEDFEKDNYSLASEFGSSHVICEIFDIIQARHQQENEEAFYEYHDKVVAEIEKYNANPTLENAKVVIEMVDIYSDLHKDTFGCRSEYVLEHIKNWEVYKKHYDIVREW